MKLLFEATFSTSLIKTVRKYWKNKQLHFFTCFELGDLGILTPVEATPCHPIQTAASLIERAVAGVLTGLCWVYPKLRE